MGWRFLVLTALFGTQKPFRVSDKNECVHFHRGQRHRESLAFRSNFKRLWKLDPWMSYSRRINHSVFYFLLLIKNKCLKIRKKMCFRLYFLCTRGGESMILTDEQQPTIRTWVSRCRGCAQVSADHLRRNKMTNQFNLNLNPIFTQAQHGYWLNNLGSDRKLCNPEHFYDYAILI